MSCPRVITIDGPSGAGKGTVAMEVAQVLGWALLDSGALYRIVGYAAECGSVSLEDGEAVARLVPGLDIRFLPDTGGMRVLLNGRDVSDQIRTERGGELASRVAVHQPVRNALLALQRGFAGGAGLVADGRDMGTVVFPDAPLKIFLTASAEERAQRRYKQLKDKGDGVSLPRLLEDIRQRDERDASRAVAPLVPAPDALLIDSTGLSIEEVRSRVLAEATRRGLV